MPELTLYYLTFPQGFHIGSGTVESVQDSIDYIPSDTLFAALIDSWVHAGRRVEEILPPNGIKITSAFPFAGSVRFYPCPVDLRALFSEDLLEREGANKRTKRIRYISAKLLEKAAGGEKLDDYLFPEDEYEDPKTGLALQGGALWLLQEEAGDLPVIMQVKPEKYFTLRRKSVYTHQTAPRVTVDRINLESNLFQSERVVFNQECGLWFGVSSPVAGMPDLLDRLGEDGLGGERSVGFGTFICSAGKTISISQPTTTAYLLSRYYPASQEEVTSLRASLYRLQAVSGWLRTPQDAQAQRRKRVWMIAEGSLIAGLPQGGVAEVCPEYEDRDNPGTFIRSIPHDVYRPGYAVAMDWKWREG